MRKKALITRNKIEYLYTVVEKPDCIKITVYKQREWFIKKYKETSCHNQEEPQ